MWFERCKFYSPKEGNVVKGSKYIYTHTHTHTHIYIYLSIYIYIYINVYIDVYRYRCIDSNRSQGQEQPGPNVVAPIHETKVITRAHPGVSFLSCSTSARTASNPELNQQSSIRCASTTFFLYVLPCFFLPLYFIL